MRRVVCELGLVIKNEEKEEYESKKKKKDTKLS